MVMTDRLKSEHNASGKYTMLANDIKVVLDIFAAVVPE